jgi:hypothetical protein
VSNDHSALVSKVWRYAHVLRDQGIGYGDHVEQISCLLFPKMDQEHSALPGGPGSIPEAWRWVRLAPLAGRHPRRPARTQRRRGEERRRLQGLDQGQHFPEPGVPAVA